MREVLKTSYRIWTGVADSIISGDYRNTKCAPKFIIYELKYWVDAGQVVRNLMAEESYLPSNRNSPESERIKMLL